MSSGSLLAFLGIALVDSINPSAIVVTLQLLGRRAPLGAVLVYIGAVFLTFATVMVLLTLGLSALLEPLTVIMETTAANVVLAVVGAGMLGYAVFSRNPQEGEEPKALKLTTAAASGLFLLGVTVTVMELPTAFPLLGAIGLLTSAQLATPAWLALILVYNAIFVLPPLLITFGYRWIGQRGGAARERRLSSGARSTLLWVLGIVGFYVLAYALTSLGVFGDSVTFEFG